MMTPIDVLKDKLTRVEQAQDTCEDMLDGLDKERDNLMEEFKALGILKVDLKAAIKKLQET